MKSGIYLIVCEENDCVYIGRANNVDMRLSQHFYHLSKNKHHNKRLQEDFNKYGIEKFEAQFVESIQKVEDMKKAEKKWGAKYPKNYNLRMGRPTGKLFKFVDKTI